MSIEFKLNWESLNSKFEEIEIIERDEVEWFISQIEEDKWYWYYDCTWDDGTADDYYQLQDDVHRFITVFYKKLSKESLDFLLDKLEFYAQVYAQVYESESTKERNGVDNITKLERRVKHLENKLQTAFELAKEIRKLGSKNEDN